MIISERSTINPPAKMEVINVISDNNVFLSFSIDKIWQYR